MVKTASKMMPLGTLAPDFELYDVMSGKTLSLADLKSSTATVIMFICNHCPFVVHIQETLVALANHYQAKGIQFIAINSNDIANYPEDGPNAMRELAQQLDFHFPFLLDEDQTVAKKYQAACTPDFFVFDDALRCVYRGQFDDSRPGNDKPVTGRDLQEALEALLHGQTINPEQHPSVGCNIKWKD